MKEYEEIEAFPYQILGEDKKYWQPKNVLEFRIDDFIESIDPRMYFATSGEAVIKAKQLEKDYWRNAGNARRLTKLLEKIKGDAKYLESTWEEGRLLLKHKNSRKKRKINK